jgi:hypothetical protein
MEKKKTHERRQFSRFSTNDATISINSHTLQLIDICFGGLSFSYSGNQKLPAISQQNCTLTGANHFQLENIPLTYIADTDFDQSGKTRRRSMSFGELSSNQLLQLMSFIRDNTSPQVQRTSLSGLYGAA